MKTVFKIKTIAFALLAMQMNFSYAQDAKAKPALTIPETIAMVGETAVTKADYDTLIDYLTKRGQPTPENMAQVKLLTENYAQQLALLEKAKAAGIESDPDYLLQKKFFGNDMIINAFVAKLSKEIDVSDAEVKSAYDAEEKRLKNMPAADKKEYKAAHIVVADKKTADKIIAELKAKKTTFSKAAKQYGKDDTANSGGELGWFTSKMMLPAFIKGIESLKPGVSSTPIKTEFGYHIVNLQETRMPIILPFEKVKTELKQQLIGERIQKKVKAEVETITIKNLIP